jgi:hypothetical protein
MRIPGIGAVCVGLFLVSLSGVVFAQGLSQVQSPNLQPKFTPNPNLQQVPNNPQVAPLPKLQPKVIPNPNLKPMPIPQPKPLLPNLPHPKPHPMPAPNPGWNHGPHHGGDFGFFIQPGPSGHYEMVTETIMVSPERLESCWVPPEYNTVTDDSGNAQVIKVRDGYMAERVIPAQYQTVTRQVWVSNGGPSFGLGFRF